MVCNNACKVIEPLRSRCICLRIAAPPVDHIAPLLMNVYKREVKGKELPRDKHAAVADAAFGMDVGEVRKVAHDPVRNSLGIWVIKRLN